MAFPKKSKLNSSFAQNHGAHTAKGHSGLVKTGAKAGKGNLMVSPANVKALGSKGKG